MVDCIGCIVELIIFKCCGYFSDILVYFCCNLVVECVFGRCWIEFGYLFVFVYFGKVGGVLEFGGKVLFVFSCLVGYV